MNPNQQAPNQAPLSTDYLDEISAAPQKSDGPPLKKILIFGGIGLVLSDGGVTACKYRIFGFKNTTAPAMAAFQMLSEQLMQARIDFLFRLKIDDADERIAAADTFCVSFVEKLAVLMHVKNKEIDNNILDAVFY